MADQYEPLLSEVYLFEFFLESGFTIKPGCDDLKPYVYKAGRAIERATIEAFRAKHLPELNLQRCYDIQRDDLMKANQRCVELERQLAQLTAAPAAR